MTFVSKITYAEGICPYQIEGEILDGYTFYLQYWNGRLRCYELHDSAGSDSSGEIILDVKAGKDYDGYPSRDLLFFLNGVVVFPSDFNFFGIYPRRTLVLKNERPVGI